MENLEKYSGYITDLAVTYVPRIVLAILALMIGFWLVKKVHKILAISMERSKMAPEIRSFATSFLDIAMKVAVILFVASILGFQLTSLVAILAAAGFAVGMALQGSLGNFAAGIMILGIKPYRVGDWVEIQDKFGQIDTVQIFNTTMTTPGQKTLIIPNGQVMEGVITNFSTKEHIRLELEVTMPYAESFPRVEEIIRESLRGIPQIIQYPEAEVGIKTYDSHNIVVAVRPYIKAEHYWEVTFAAYRKIKENFNKNDIKVAYSEGVELGPIGL